MVNRISRKLLLLKSRIYISLLYVLSIFSLQTFTGCTVNNKSKDPSANDSAAQKIQYLEMQLKEKKDSLAALRNELARTDSLKKSRISKPKKNNKVPSPQNPVPQKPTYTPQLPAVDYGVNPYYDEPTIKAPK